MKSQWLGTAAVLVLSSSAFAGDAVFTVIGPGRAVDMSPDGQFVLITGGDGAAIWTEADGIFTIGGGDGVAISDDGMIVLGEIDDPDTGLNAAGLWTMSTGWVSLGGLPGQTGCDLNLSNPYDLSGAGDVAVGLGWEGCGGRAFRWTDPTGMLALPQIGPNSARANVISGDGLTIGGWDEAPTGPRRAAIWYDDGTEELILEGTPGNAEGIGEVWAFSTDGTVAAGQTLTDPTFGGGFRFLNGKVNIISPLPGTDPFFFATVGLAVPDDGSVVYGTNISGFGPFAIRDGIYWTEADGTQVFQDFLVANGAVIPDGLFIASVEAVTPDGQTFAGWALELPFTQIAWYASFGQDAIEASLDIRPLGCPNPFNPRSQGVLPVALLGDADFDVSQVDISSLSIEGVAPIMGPPGPHPRIYDVAGLFEGGPCECDELGPDEFMDLVMHFRTQDLAEVVDLTDGSGVLELCLTGTLLDGTPFEACDCITFVPVRDGSNFSDGGFSGSSGTGR
ncbi:MAG: hypothetical protein ACYTGG_13180 [Planctomycetota bacterium]|jgi:hypothetical protein